MHHVFPLGIAEFLSGYNIANAALPDGASYGTRTMGTVTSARVGSIDIFYARTKFGTLEYLWTTDTGSGGNAFLSFQADDTLLFNIATPTGSANIVRRVTNRKFRDTHPVHIHIDYDTNQTDNTSCTITINNVVETSFSTTTNPGSAQDGALTTGSTEWVFTNWTPASYATGYAAHFRRFDGTQVAASNFIEESSITGNPVAVNYTGSSYGNEGWFLDFADGTSATTMLYDQSGNANNFTAAGTPTVTQVASTPTDVFCTPNPLDSGAFTFSNGNLTIDRTGAWTSGHGTFKIPATGKWGIKATINSLGGAATYAALGLSTVNNLWTSAPGVSTTYDYTNAGAYNDLGTPTGGKTAWSATDVVEILIDRDNTTLSFKLNGASEGNLTTSLSADDLFLFVSMYTANITFDFGQNGYVPSETGYETLSTNNLPAMAATDKNVNSHFKTVPYTGTNATLAITDVGFSPALTWLKGRSPVSSHYVFDVIRGANEWIATDRTDAETTSTDLLMSFDALGFTLGADAGDRLNDLNKTYVAWCFNLPTSQGNTDGSITVASGKQRVGGPGFEASITEFTGTGANATVGHGLSKAPGVVIVKKLNSAGEWVVQHVSVGPTKYLFLNSTAAAATLSTVWNDTAPTDTVVHLGSDASVNSSGNRFLMICFAECDFIKIGSYEGNANTNGPVATENLSPVFVLSKNADAVAGWPIQDAVVNPYNPIDLYLLADSSQAEASATTNVGAPGYDYLATGAKPRNSNVTWNGSSNTHCYLMIGQPTGASNADEANGR